MSHTPPHEPTAATASHAGAAAPRVAERWPNCGNRDGWLRGCPSYSEILDSFGEVLIDCTDNDYQGDTFALVRDAAGRLGYVQFGWGSCSGCDSLEACSTVDEVQELVDSLFSGIEWSDDENALRAWHTSKDWSGQFSWYCHTGRDFVAKLDELLGTDVVSTLKGER